MRVCYVALVLVGCVGPDRRVDGGRAATTLELIGLGQRRLLTATDFEALGAEDVQWANHGAPAFYRATALGTLLAHGGLVAGKGGPGVDPREKHLDWRRIVVATAADGFTAVFSSAELASAIGPTRAWLAFAREGEALGRGEGPFRLLVGTDTKGSRSARGAGSATPGGVPPSTRWTARQCADTMCRWRVQPMAMDLASSRCGPMKPCSSPS
jgi:hypothetical protein